MSALAACAGLVNVALCVDAQNDNHREDAMQKKRPLLGVIRWDAFNGGDSKTNPELKSLSPSKCHDRVPFFLKIESENQVSGSENNQDAIDRQIEYAKSAGIDYWAFITGPEMDPNGMEFYALDKFLKSEHKSDIGFCVILHIYNSSWESRVKALVGFFKEPSYIKVPGNRPLLYLYSIGDMEAQYGKDTKKNLDILMNETVAAGLGRPYVVFMSPSAAGAAKVKEYGADALSSYANWEGKDMSYAALAASDLKRWEAFSKTGVKVIPLVSLGWNGMPRIDNPPPWGVGGAGGRLFDLPKPEEAAAHIRQGFEFVQSHPEVCDAHSILCYAWNEFCEGGWLCPTYGEGTARLDAVRKMVDQYNEKP